MIILPTIYRPDNLSRFVKAYNDTGSTLPIHVVFDERNAYQYNDIATPEHWTRCSVTAGIRIGQIFNIMFKKFPNEEFYGVVADDVVPETPGWDRALRNACLPDKIAWGFDGGRDESLPRHPFIGGELVRDLGFIAAPGIKHWFVDNAWRDISNVLNCGIYLPNVKIVHHHHTNGKSFLDRTYETQPNHMADGLAYDKFTKESLPDIINRLSPQKK